MSGPREWFQRIMRAGAIWSEARASTLGAALAYFMVFSIAPLLLLLLALAGLIYGPEDARGRLAGELENTLGPDASTAVQDILRNMDASGATSVSLGVGAVLLLFGASGVFAELQRALNAIWGVKPKPGFVGGVVGFLRGRFLSLGMVFGTCFLILAGLVLATSLTFVASHIRPPSDAVWSVKALSVAGSFSAVMLLFSLIYRYLPDAEVRWGDAVAGAVLTTTLYLVVRELLSLYFSRTKVATVYGAAGSLVVVLLWVYYSAQIFLFGAALCRARAERTGRGVVPEPHAVLRDDVREA